MGSDLVFTAMIHRNMSLNPCSMDNMSIDQAPPVESLHLLCEVRPSADDQVTLAHSVCRCGQCVAAQCQISHPNPSLCCCRL